MKNAFRVCAALCCSLLLLAGCGQKGPLFLPGDPGTIQTTIPASTTVEDSDSPPADDDDPEDEDNN